MVEEIKKDARVRMGKCVEVLAGEFARLRTGRAHTSLLEHIRVPYYGTDTPLNQIASLSASDARTLTVQPWDKQVVAAVEKAIRNSDLGLNPVTAGEVIRIPVPALTEERRKELTRVVRQEAENARVAVRNVRRDANQQLKSLIKDDHLGEDEEHRAEQEVQDLTNEFITEIDELLKAKEEDLLEV